tara:strand:+ start:898 stop:1350 length:453 start_codon:yes stop_codon:yes gene_type:complete
MGSSFSQTMEILSAEDAHYIKITPVHLTDDFLFFQSDSIKIEEINSVRMIKNNDIPITIKAVLATGYFSLFYYMLEYMYKEAPFTIPQFSGVFSVFIIAGTGAGIIYGKIINSYPDGKTSYDFSTMPVEEKYTILQQILTKNKVPFHKTP